RGRSGSCADRVPQPPPRGGSAGVTGSRRRAVEQFLELLREPRRSRVFVDRFAKGKLLRAAKLFERQRPHRIARVESGGRDTLRFGEGTERGRSESERAEQRRDCLGFGEYLFGAGHLCQGSQRAALARIGRIRNRRAQPGKRVDHVRQRRIEERHALRLGRRAAAPAFRARAWRRYASPIAVWKISRTGRSARTRAAAWRSPPESVSSPSASVLRASARVSRSSSKSSAGTAFATSAAFDAYTMPSSARSRSSPESCPRARSRRFAIGAARAVPGAGAVPLFVVAGRA